MELTKQTDRGVSEIECIGVNGATAKDSDKTVDKHYSQRKTRLTHTKSLTNTQESFDDEMTIRSRHSSENFVRPQSASSHGSTQQSQSGAATDNDHFSLGDQVEFKVGQEKLSSSSCSSGAAPNQPEVKGTVTQTTSGGRIQRPKSSKGRQRGEITSEDISGIHVPLASASRPGPANSNDDVDCQGNADLSNGRTTPSTTLLQMLVDNGTAIDESIDVNRGILCNDVPLERPKSAWKSNRRYPKYTQFTQNDDKDDSLDIEIETFNLQDDTQTTYEIIDANAAKTTSIKLEPGLNFNLSTPEWNSKISPLTLRAWPVCELNASTIQPSGGISLANVSPTRKTTKTKPTADYRYNTSTNNNSISSCILIESQDGCENMYDDDARRPVSDGSRSGARAVAVRGDDSRQRYHSLPRHPPMTAKQNFPGAATSTIAPLRMHQLRKLEPIGRSKLTPRAHDETWPTAPTVAKEGHAGTGVVNNKLHVDDENDEERKHKLQPLISRRMKTLFPGEKQSLNRHNRLSKSMRLPSRPTVLSVSGLTDTGPAASRADRKHIMQTTNQSLNDENYTISHLTRYRVTTKRESAVHEEEEIRGGREAAVSLSKSLNSSASQTGLTGFEVGNNDNSTSLKIDSHSVTRSIDSNFAPTETSTTNAAVPPERQRAINSRSHTVLISTAPVINTSHSNQDDRASDGKPQDGGVREAMLRRDDSLGGESIVDSTTTVVLRDSLESLPYRADNKEQERQEVYNTITSSGVGQNSRDCVAGEVPTNCHIANNMYENARKRDGETTSAAAALNNTMSKRQEYETAGIEERTLTGTMPAPMPGTIDLDPYSRQLLSRRGGSAVSQSDLLALPLADSEIEKEGKRNSGKATGHILFEGAFNEIVTEQHSTALPSFEDFSLFKGNIVGVGGGVGVNDYDPWGRKSLADLWQETQKRCCD